VNGGHRTKRAVQEERIHEFLHLSAGHRGVVRRSFLDKMMMVTIIIVIHGRALAAAGGKMEEEGRWTRVWTCCLLFETLLLYWVVCCVCAETIGGIDAAVVCGVTACQNLEKDGTQPWSLVNIQSPRRQDLPTLGAVG
jgi:hypothetical protein